LYLPHWFADSIKVFNKYLIRIRALYVLCTVSGAEGTKVMELTKILAHRYNGVMRDTEKWMESRPSCKASWGMHPLKKMSHSPKEKP
jgi:hypothetical protein